jgi:hypothetical protein
MSTKNGSRVDDLQPEYDLRALTGAVRGKYFGRASSGATVVVLEPDVAEAFPTSEAVNEALRALAKVARTHVPESSKLPNKPLQPTSRKRRPTKARRGAPARG